MQKLVSAITSYCMHRFTHNLNLGWVSTWITLTYILPTVPNRNEWQLCQFLHVVNYMPIIISPNKVFGDIMVLASPPPRPPRRREHSNSKSIQPISFKFDMRVDTPLRFFAIEIWYPPRTRTTAFAAKQHLYPPNLQNAISPLVMTRLLSNCIQRWRIWSYIKKNVND